MKNKSKYEGSQRIRLSKTRRPMNRKVHRAVQCRDLSVASCLLDRSRRDKVSMKKKRKKKKFQEKWEEGGIYVMPDGTKRTLAEARFGLRTLIGWGGKIAGSFDVPVTI